MEVRTIWQRLGVKQQELIYTELIALKEQLGAQVSGVG